MKVVIDTNVLISGIFFGGHPNRILEHWLTGNIELIITIPILIEYRRVIREITKKYGKIEYKQWNKYLTEFTTIIEPIKIHSDCRDNDDIKFLEVAVS
jgi:putative PIN family toxin of toxin-antitoxin system